MVFGIAQVGIRDKIMRNATFACEANNIILQIIEAELIRTNKADIKVYATIIYLLVFE